MGCKVRLSRFEPLLDHLPAEAGEMPSLLSLVKQYFSSIYLFAYFLFEAKQPFICRAYSFPVHVL